MTIIMLAIFLGDFPFLTYGKLATFETMKECRAHIAKEAPEKWRNRMECLQVVRADSRSA